MYFNFQIKYLIQIYICIGKIYAIPETAECWHKQGIRIYLLNKYKFSLCEI